MLSEFLRHWFIDPLRPGIVQAGSGVMPCEGTVTVEEALAAEAERYRAQMAGDLPALERLLAEDLVYFHSSTLRDTKAAFLEALRSGAVRYRRMTLGDVTVRVYGGLAIIAGQGVFDVTVNGQDMTLALQFHSIWARRASGLQFVSCPATRLPAEG